MATDQYRGDKLLDAAGVNADLARKVKAVLADVRGHGKGVLVTQVKRSVRTQRAYYAKGRSDAELRAVKFTTAQIKQARADGGSASLKPVTWSMASKHLKGMAADLVPVNDGVVDWGDSAGFALIGKAARAHGLVWGGDWHKKDTPHVELAS